MILLCRINKVNIADSRKLHYDGTGNTYFEGLWRIGYDQHEYRHPKITDPTISAGGL
jgi:hypothetical protein